MATRFGDECSITYKSYTFPFADDGNSYLLPRFFDRQEAEDAAKYLRDNNLTIIALTRAPFSSEDRAEFSANLVAEKSLSKDLVPLARPVNLAPLQRFNIILKWHRRFAHA